MERHVGEVAEQAHGLWTVAVWPGRAQELLACLDPDAPFVVFTCGSPNLGWHVAPVSIHDEPPQPRLVRGVSFELQVNPVEAARLGPLAQASHNGSLDCVQSRRSPLAAADLPEHGAGRAAVMRREGVVLAIHLPHDNEVAVVTAPVAKFLEEFVLRFKQHAQEGRGEEDW